ncbi:MAG: hypothetical protein PUA57_08040, partial [Eggerthellales bacterium]|nr:hypothetical protein [Eggerthellales bacterium]
MTRSITIRLNLLAAALVLAIAACVLPAAQQQAFAEETFTVTGAQFVGVSGEPALEYTGDAIEPEVELVTDSGKTISASDYSGNAFKAIYYSNINVGQAFVRIIPSDELKAAVKGADKNYTLSFSVEPQYLVAAT